MARAKGPSGASEVGPVDVIDVQSSQTSHHVEDYSSREKSRCQSSIVSK